MRVGDIQAGKFYYDGKEGIRQVLAVRSTPVQVEYRAISAKQRMRYDAVSRRVKSSLGGITQMKIESFAHWAKIELDDVEADRIATEVMARKVPISPGGIKFLESAVSEAGMDLLEGVAVSYDRTEGRAVYMLEKKGLVIRHNGDAIFTKLGAAWVRARTKSTPDEEVAAKLRATP